MIPIPRAGARTYGGAMAHRRRSIIRFLFIALFLSRGDAPARF